VRSSRTLILVGKACRLGKLLVPVPGPVLYKGVVWKWSSSECNAGGGELRSNLVQTWLLTYQPVTQDSTGLTFTPAGGYACPNKIGYDCSEKTLTGRAISNRIGDSPTVCCRTNITPWSFCKSKPTPNWFGTPSSAKSSPCNEDNFSHFLLILPISSRLNRARGGSACPPPC